MFFIQTILNIIVFVLVFHHYILAQMQGYTILMLLSNRSYLLYTISELSGCSRLDKARGFPNPWKVSRWRARGFPNPWKVSRWCARGFPNLWKVSRWCARGFPNPWKVSRWCASSASGFNTSNRAFCCFVNSILFNSYSFNYS